MNKHTPGPWKTDGLSVQKAWDDKMKNVRTNYRNFICPENEDRDTLNILVNSLVPEVSEANAKLVAAAPDLLDGCEQLMDNLVWAAPVNTSVIIPTEIFHKIYCAVKRARGEK